MKRARTLCELYSFSGFRAAAQLKSVFGDTDLRVVRCGVKVVVSDLIRNDRSGSAAGVQADRS